jgi:hypothetical protein
MTFEDFWQDYVKSGKEKSVNGVVMIPLERYKMRLSEAFEEGGSSIPQGKTKVKPAKYGAPEASGDQAQLFYDRMMFYMVKNKTDTKTWYTMTEDRLKTLQQEFGIQ